MPPSVKERYKDELYAQELRPSIVRSIGGFTVTSFTLPHDGTENYGYYITHPEMGRFVYMTDLEYSPLRFKNANVEHFLCEVNYCEELVEREEEQYTHRLRGHLSLNTFLDKVLRVNMTPALRTVTLCHLSDTAADEQMILERVKEICGDRVEVNIAKPGLQVEINKYPF